MFQIRYSFKIVAVAFIFLLVTSCCKDETTACVENIDTDCFCTLQYDPVCGCNKKTYGNSCQAECAGITEYTKGECTK